MRTSAGPDRHRNVTALEEGRGSTITIDGVAVSPRDLLTACTALAAQLRAVALPAHDVILSDAGRMLTDQALGLLWGGVDYWRVAAGEALALG